MCVGVYIIGRVYCISFIECIFFKVDFKMDLVFVEKLKCRCFVKFISVYFMYFCNDELFLMVFDNNYFKNFVIK